MPVVVDDDDLPGSRRRSARPGGCPPDASALAPCPAEIDIPEPGELFQAMGLGPEARDHPYPSLALSENDRPLGGGPDDDSLDENRLAGDAAPDLPFRTHLLPARRRFRVGEPGLPGEEPGELPVPAAPVPEKDGPGGALQLDEGAPRGEPGGDDLPEDPP